VLLLLVANLRFPAYGQPWPVWSTAAGSAVGAVLIALVAVHLYLMRRHGISGPVRPRAGDPRPFFPYQAARDLTVAVAVGVFLAALAWKGAPALEPPADPTSSDYVPRPEWYFLGLFQLLKLFPGRLEVIGALVLPGVAMTLLALLPWIDRGQSRQWRARKAVLGAFTAGLAGLTTLTVLGARDRPVAAPASWNVRELAGVALLTTGDRCASCHNASGAAAPIEAGRIGRPADWLAMHVADPIVIAPGLREPPESNERDNVAMLAALARMRSGETPPAGAAVAAPFVTINRSCIGCHTIDGVGGDEGPDLSQAGKDADAPTIERRITEPRSVDPGAQMPAFGGRLTPAEIHAIAVWLAARK
jgi:ubiquinol-cytochrome c reductase cytochrome b subunit